MIQHPQTDDIKAAIHEVISSKAWESGPAAAIDGSDVDKLLTTWQVASDSPCRYADVLLHSMTAMCAQRTLRTSARTWAQWFNVLAGALATELVQGAAHGWSSESVSQLNQSINHLRRWEQAAGDAIDPEWIVEDVVASIAAGFAWAMLVNGVPIEELASICDDEVLQEYLQLYEYRLHFRLDAIIRHLDGQSAVTRDPIKLAFWLFAMVGQRRTRSALDNLPIEWRSLYVDGIPLASAKLLAYAVRVAPPLGRGSRDNGGYDEDTDGEASEGYKLVVKALAVWYAHGVDRNYYLCRATMSAGQGDYNGVNAAMDSVLKAIIAQGGATDDYLKVTEDRQVLIQRLIYRDQMSSIDRIQDQAEHALQVAKDGATQAPALIGLFTAVIALVLGTTQIGQDLPAQQRLILIVGLAVVLLSFVLTLSVMTRFVAAQRTSIYWVAGMLGVVLAFTTAAFVALYLLL